jgi:hypothetical protein
MACPVCFGGEDIAVRESMNAGIGVLLAVTAVVLGVFARFFVNLARRSRENSHLVEWSTRTGSDVSDLHSSQARPEFPDITPDPVSR